MLASFAALSAANELPEAGKSSSNCWVDAGTYYAVDPWLLYTLAQKESSMNPNAINRNNDGTYDIGLMQINSFFLPTLAKYGITESMLYHPCTNIHVGAWVLRQGMSVFGNNWRAVGAYNAGTRKTEKVESLREAYASDVYRRYRDNFVSMQQLAEENPTVRAGDKTTKAE